MGSFIDIKEAVAKEAVAYGYKALGEAVRHDRSNIPDVSLSLEIERRHGCYSYEGWDAFPLGFFAGAFVVPTANSREGVIVLTALSVLFSSLAAFGASAYNFARGWRLESKALDGESNYSKLKPADDRPVGPKLQAILNIYQKAALINKGIAYKKAAYGISCFVLAGGLSILTVTAVMLLFRSQNFGWAAVAPALVLVGGGTIGIFVTWVAKKKWIPEKDNQNSVAASIKGLIENNRKLFTTEVLVELKIVRYQLIFVR